MLGNIIGEDKNIYSISSIFLYRAYYFNVAENKD